MRQYDLVALEDGVQAAYLTYLSAPDSAVAKLFFDRVLELTRAVLTVSSSWRSYQIDRSAIAYDYAIYLLERVLSGAFCPSYQDRFPWQRYIDSSLRSIVYPMFNDSKDLSLEELEGYTDLVYFGFTASKKLTSLELGILKQEFVNDVLRGLKLFYSEEEVGRLYFISADYLGTFYIQHLPKDIFDFICILRSIVKRLASSPAYQFNSKAHSVTTFKQSLVSSTRSTVFLSSVLKHDLIPKPLLLALDIESLYRLSYIAGGSTVRVPTLQELNTLIGVVATVTKILLENKDMEEALKESKDQLQLIFSNNKNHSVRAYITRLLESYSLFSQDTSDTTLMQLVLSSLTSLERIAVQGSEELKRSHPETVIQFYSELVSSINTLGEFLVKINASLETNQQDIAKEL